MGVYCREAYGVQEAVVPNMADRAQDVPPSKVTWGQLSAIAALDAGQGVELWQEIKEAARQEMRSGSRAFGALATSQDAPMDKARFLTVRETFSEEWKPRGGIEGTLIDQMAQAWTMQLYWTDRLTTRTATDGAEDLKEQRACLSDERKGEWRYGEWVPPRVSTAEAVQEAMNMADRWNRMFVRTLRQLRDLRRYPVVVQNAGQVNVGHQQVNLSAARPRKAAAKKQRPGQKQGGD